MWYQNTQLWRTQSFFPWIGIFQTSSSSYQSHLPTLNPSDICSGLCITSQSDINALCLVNRSGLLSSRFWKNQHINQAFLLWRNESISKQVQLTLIIEHSDRVLDRRGLLIKQSITKTFPLKLLHIQNSYLTCRPTDESYSEVMRGSKQTRGTSDSSTIDRSKNCYMYCIKWLTMWCILTSLGSARSP